MAKLNFKKRSVQLLFLNGWDKGTENAKTGNNGTDCTEDIGHNNDHQDMGYPIVPKAFKGGGVIGEIFKVFDFRLADGCFR